MSHIIPAHKKNDRRYINNHHSASLLPICGKIFERILYNPVFLCLENNNLLTPNQSGVRSNYSCVNQLLSIVHRLYSDFDENPSLEVKSNFLDISKAFDKIWHEGLLFKLSDWAFKWKMLFNPDVTKQAQEVIFSRKSNKADHPVVYFNEAPVAKAYCQKHLGMHLDEKLNCNTHITEKISKANKVIGIIRKLAHLLPRKFIITI